MKILVTGGLGYIGSHTVVALQEQGYEVIIIDNLSNASIDVLDGIEKITGIRPEFEWLDLRDKQKVDDFFAKYTPLDGIVHFASSKAVGESMQQPLLYYENNLFSLINVLSVVQKYNVNNFIFSSSCIVYGQADTLPIKETESIKSGLPPYGNTKAIGEEIIIDLAKTYPIQSIILRYFNPIGAHPSAAIGEVTIDVPHNLVPFITQTAMGMHEYLAIYGNDYNTADGTCVRDYIHVVDLADAHVKALNRLIRKENNKQTEEFNIGNGQGYSVLELVHSFERISGIKLNYKIVGRRSGDVDMAWADNTKAKEILQWQPTKSLDEMLESAWNWEKKVKGV